jgi:hypothetical protein
MLSMGHLYRGHEQKDEEELSLVLNPQGFGTPIDNTN